jgi:hypothetical protein
MGYSVQALSSTRGYRGMEEDTGLSSDEDGFEKDDLTQAYGRGLG